MLDVPSEQKQETEPTAQRPGETGRRNHDIEAPSRAPLEVEQPRRKLTRGARKAAPPRRMVSGVVLGRNMQPTRVKAAAEDIGESSLKHAADGLTAAPAFGRGSESDSRIQQADGARQFGETEARCFTQVL